MPIPNYTPERRREVAQLLRIDEQYLYQIIRRLKVPSPALVRRFMDVEPKVLASDLRPDDWQTIWPELVTEHQPLWA